MLPELSTASTSATSTSARGVRSTASAGTASPAQRRRRGRDRHCIPSHARFRQQPSSQFSCGIVIAIYTKRLAGLEAGPPGTADCQASPQLAGLTGHDASAASEGARSREHPHPARGGRPGGPAGAALFDRQGFLGAAASGAQGVLSRPAAIPAAAHRYDVEVPRHDHASATPPRSGSASICACTPIPRGCGRTSIRSTTAATSTPR